MNVQQLINTLSTLPPEMMVLASSDPEGNSFDTVTDFSIEHIEKEYTGGATEDLFFLDEDDEEDTEVDVSARFKKVVVLWP